MKVIKGHYLTSAVTGIKSRSNHPYFTDTVGIATQLKDWNKQFKVWREQDKKSAARQALIRSRGGRILPDLTKG